MVRSVRGAQMAAHGIAIVMTVLVLSVSTAGAAPPPGATAPANLHRLSTWVDLTNHTGPTPTPRQAYGMAYDPALRVVVMFGGNAANGSALGDTWEFASGHWKNLKLNASSSPSARWSAGFAYDPSLGGILLFGGQDYFVAGCRTPCPYAFNDTWLFNATGWHDLHLSFAPPPQPASSLVYDSHDGYALLVGHPVAYTVSYTEEWRFLGGKWVNATAKIVGRPPAHLFFFQVDDPATCYVLLFGGEPGGGCRGEGLTWEYRNGTFRNATTRQTVTPTATQGSHAITYDPRVHGIVMTGGYDNSCRVTNQTWLFQNGRWQDISNLTGTAIPGRWDARLVWDPYLLGRHGGDLTFSGNEAVRGGGNHFGKDTWSL